MFSVYADKTLKKGEKKLTPVISQVRLRFSQLAPSNSSVHLHEYESAPVIVQVPPFLHGPGLQGLTEKKIRFDSKHKCD